MAVREGDEIKNLNIKRGQVRANITRFRKYLDSVKADSIDVLGIKQRLSNFTPNFQKFDEIQSEIELLSDVPVENNDRDEFESEYYELLNRAEKLIIVEESKTKLNSVGTPTGSENLNYTPAQTLETKELHARMPAISILPFSGAYNQWLSFSDSFKSLVDSHPSLSDVSKLHYLKSSLQGEALDLIQDLETCSANYSVSWKLLEDTYNKERLIVQDHVRALLDAPECPNKESHVGLKQLINICQRNIRSLKRLKRPVDSWDDLLIPILVSKIDTKTAQEWEGKLSKNKMPTVAEFIEFLTRRVDILECINMKQKQGQGSKASVPQHTKKSTVHLVSTSYNCPFCTNNHQLFKCTGFLQQSPEQRLNSVKSFKLCINCFGNNHSNRQCKYGRCKTCKGRHNTLLHFNKNDNQSTHSVNSQQQSNNSNKDERTARDNNICAYLSSPSEVLLSTALVHVPDSQGNIQECRALLDQGSQLNLITDSCANKLGLPRRSLQISISGVNEKQSTANQTVKLVIKSRFSKYQQTVECVVLSQITKKLPLTSFDTSSFEIRQGIKLADPKYNISRDIDILLGADVFYQLLCAGQVPPPKKGQPLLQKTQLGWLVTGKAPIQTIGKPLACNLSIHERLDEHLVRFWKVDEIQHADIYSAEEREVERHFLSTHSRDPTGRFVVKLPFKQDASSLGDSKNMALKRFYNLERKLHKQPQLLVQYQQFMTEYLHLGHMSIAPPDNTEFQASYYLPHHSVLKEDSLTTKLRVVFDASAKTTSGKSLNDILMVGPSIQQDLFSILARFRTHKFVISGDIAKMYRQVLVYPDDRHFQKILWRFNPEDPVAEYELSTVTYGTAPASFLATRCLHQLAHEHQQTLPQGARAIVRDFYVDDFLSGGDDLDELVALRKQVVDILQRGGFELRKWASNDKRVLAGIDTTAENSIIDVDKNPNLKTLGMQWHTGNDEFRFTIRECNNTKRVTKRTILSDIAQIFDPLGLMNPVIVTAKLLIQRLWQQGIGWDESVSLDIHTTWFFYRQSLEKLNKLKVPRRVIPTDQVHSIEIHGFCDASELAYGACVYIRSTGSSNDHYSCLLCSKSRVAPLKALSIPRLELCAAVLLSQLVTKVLQIIQVPVQRTILWSDSTIVLSWIGSSSRSYNAFVANRIGEIQDLTSAYSWRHVGTCDNPADLISRGVSTDRIIEDPLWWHGPEWLSQNEVQWPNTVSCLSDIDMTLEIKKSAVVQSATIQEDFHIFSLFSSFVKLVRITAWCIRFYNATKFKVKVQGALTVNDFKNALTHLIKHVQSNAFKDDILHIQKHGMVSKNSKILSLSPFITADNILRVGGRLRHANLPYDMKHPILLPSKHLFTTLLIKHIHEKQLHAGHEGTLAALRQEYWPISARNNVKNIIKQCVTCFRANPIAMQPKMGDLPVERLEPSRPFLISGVDFCGPFKLKEGSRKSKRIVKAYAAIFVCFATKAVHVELVGNLTSESFIAALKRFVARRGKVSQIFSDNGTNFVGANRELAEIHNFLSNQQTLDKIQNATLDERITWRFIPARSPHFGGLWEAAVKSLKHHIRRVAGDASFTSEELSTLLTETEAILNSRPLTPISSDPNDFSFLTPGHFLIGDSLTSVPEANLELIPATRLSRWQRICQAKQHFWSRWSKEYLGQLHQRSKWKVSTGPQLQQGQLVLLREDNLPPLRWKTGRVIAIHPGKDGIIRAATVKTSVGEVRRAANKLSILPIEGGPVEPQDEVQCKV